MATLSSSAPLADGQTFDVAILGGGLAGLTLALHLRRTLPHLSVAVIEPTQRPLPEAAFKVGESSVEIGSHFFEHILGLRSYLEERQYIKNGLRFFSGDTQAPLPVRREIGPSEFPTVPSFQLDRGRFEDDLRGMVERAGATLFEGYSVYKLDLQEEPGSKEPHLVSIASREDKKILAARWTVDATGRRRLIQRQYDLTRDNHHYHSAAWFRVEGMFDVKDLVPETEENRAWHARDVDHNRWLSTVHLMGKGYWVWLIPLASGFHSIGIVAGEEHHPFETFATQEAAMDWLKKHEPLVFAKLQNYKASDFKRLRRYSYTSEQVFSGNRWTCVGEAGVFVDPLYSPGSDFIAISNCLTADLIARDFEGQDISSRVDEFNHFYLNFAEVATATYRNCSHIQGAPHALAAKLYWDNFHYWSFVCQYFFNTIYKLDTQPLKKFHALHEEFFALNVKAQATLRAWAEIEPGTADGDFVSLPQFPSKLADLHIDLSTRRNADETFAVMKANLESAKEVVGELALRALASVGPERAAELAAKIELNTWNEIAIDEARFAYDETSDRASMRKSVSRVVRDMERCLGKPMGTESLRSLWIAFGPARARNLVSEAASNAVGSNAVGSSAL